MACKTPEFDAQMTRRTLRSSQPAMIGDDAPARRLPFDRRAVREGSRGRIAVFGLFFASLLQTTGGQEIPRPSAARQKVKTSLPTVSNFRVGEVMMNVDAAVATEFTDNVNLTPEKKSDVILTPSVGINFAWAVTKLNTLRFRTSLGYSYYFNSEDLNRSVFTLAPDSALSFDIYTGDFRINFHNQFSLTQDPTTQGSVSGVAQLGQFTNTIGTAILWDTNDIIWSFGYDHFNLITTGASNTDGTTTSSSYNNLDHSTDQVAASASFRISSAVIGGIEATGAISDYPDQPQSNYSSLSGGVYAEMQLTRYTHMNVAGGYKRFSARGGGLTAASISSSTDLAEDLATAVATDSTPIRQPVLGDPSGFYATLSLIHRLNRYYSDNLSLGHTEDVNPYSGLARTNFIRYAGNWQVNEKVSLGLGLFFEDVAYTGSGSLTGTVQADYQRVGFTMSTGYQLTEKVGLSLGYQFIKRESVEESQTYTQNRATISIGYRF